MSLSNWKIAYRIEDGELTVLRALSCDKIAVLPDEIDGFPVAALASRSFSPYSPDIPKDAVTVCIGPLGDSEESWDNSCIEKLILPSSLKRVGNAAFIYMASLNTIAFDDRLSVWNGNALSNCKNLKRIIIRTGSVPGPALAHIAEDMESCLDISIERNGSIDTRLIFPSYEEMTLEDGCVAQGSMFSYHINGAGYPHHHCFKSKKLNLRDYDNLWKEYIGMGHIEAEAVRLAWYRLRYPAELSDSAKLSYKDFIRSHARDALDLIISERDSQGLSLLLGLFEISEDSIAYALELARKKHCTELMPLLLEKTKGSSHSSSDDYEL